MKILIFATAYNGLTQRVHQELNELNHFVDIELSPEPEVMLTSFLSFSPDLVICPFLKHRVPDEIWQQVPCLILHPGKAGDQGPSSIDWSIIDENDYWGATLLQANEEYDAGKIWDTTLFKQRHTTKASLYRHEVTRSASSMIKNAVLNFEKDQAYCGIPISEFDKVKHQWRPLMKQSDRVLNWKKHSGRDIEKIINAGDSFPGVLDSINGEQFYHYGAFFEALDSKSVLGSSDYALGRVIGHKEEAIARLCKDGVVWIKQLKHKPVNASTTEIKLPALRALARFEKISSEINPLSSNIFGDIKVERKGQTAFLYFDFYNGAFNTQQCRQLLATFKLLEQDDSIKVISLMGGNDFWCNGIHLNCIDNAEDPAKESARNIEAIDDLVEAIIRCESKLTIAALKTNAGAGGAILPLACDYVIAREGVILNPHYQTMGLTGSEYWTYLLPKRVGKRKAKSLMESCMPITTSAALAINYVDEVLSEDQEIYQSELEKFCLQLSESSDYAQLLDSKVRLLREDEKKKPLEVYRHEELREMYKIFKDPNSSYHQLRFNFVRKIVCKKTPARLRAAIETYHAMAQ